MKPGWTIADYIPGTGYYDRIFAGVVGPKGHVYAFYPAEMKNFIKTPLPADGAKPFAKFDNVTARLAPANDFAAPGAARPGLDLRQLPRPARPVLRARPTWPRSTRPCSRR